MAKHELVIRGGTIVDGGGSAAYEADVAVDRGRVVAIGRLTQGGCEEIDARGCLITPGFVDIHTHYDGQATWEQRLSPSSDHGVTTVITGNCGVGFAPCRPADRASLIALMEGVEDIPGIVMAEGIPWNWLSFPSYMEALAAREFDIDIGVQIPHSPLRVFVMGSRGANSEPSTAADRAEMASLVTEAVRRGAIGVSTSRAYAHRARDGSLAPSVTTAHAEVLALAAGLAAADAGVFQIITELSGDPASEIGLIQSIAEVARRPVSFSLAQQPEHPDSWWKLLKGMELANAAGHCIRGQVFPRPVGVLLGLDLSLNPILTRPAYSAIAHLPLAERVRILRDPLFRARVLEESSVPDAQPSVNRLIAMVDNMFEMGPVPNYAPNPDMRLAERAKRLGISPLALAYDLMLEQEGHAVLFLPGANFSSGTLDEVHSMLIHPDTVLGLGDGGAHYGLVCDASYPTFMLSYWARDVAVNRRLSVEQAVNALSRKTAEAVGLTDRGLVAVGYKADLNVIDHDRLRLLAPYPVYDLPTGGRRLRQRSPGYVATIVNGTVVYREGEPTGALPGRLVRGSAYWREHQAA
jgi:N-acyl-D-amino-acid deacylase